MSAVWKKVAIKIFSATKEVTRQIDKQVKENDFAEVNLKNCEKR